MSERLTQKEIKHDIREDEVLHYINRTLSYVINNSRLLIGIGLGVVAVVLLGAGWNHLQDKKQDAASLAFGEAIKIEQAPILESGATPDDPKAPSFADEASRNQRAKSMFERVRADYGGTGAAEVSTIHLGRLELETGNPEGARALWSEFLKRHQDHMLAASVQVGLMSLDRDAGNGEAVVTELEAQLAARKPVLPKDLALYQLALTLESLDRNDEAIAAYRRLGDEHPESPFVSRAQAKLRELEAA
jgi:tetratricopeptide (TPR) repeat protein